MLPVVTAFILQWTLWPTVLPSAWFIFYPAVFFSSSIGGLRAGLLATAISTVLNLYFFLPPEYSWEVARSGDVFSSAIFISMGILFSLFHDHL
ncbi:MAG: DUF4118 domain-containing protein, partial [Terrimicrobiaceae bacterium]